MALRKNLARSIREGQPWIYRDALEPPGGVVADGAVVLVTTRDGRPLGRGFWSSGSPIAVRMLVTDASLDLEATIRERLGSALGRRLTLLDLRETNAFRWVHGEADGLPGMHLDVYASWASVRFDGEGAQKFYAAFTPDVLELGARRFGLAHLLGRRRGGGHRGRDDHPAESDDDAEPDAGPRQGAGVVLSATEAAREVPPAELLVRENGLVLEVDLVHGQKGGLFLDQRDNRQWLRQRVHGKTVLNLFAYTGGFSVYAAVGGARETTTVDVAAGAMAAARRNFERNHSTVAGEGTRFVTSDVFAFLQASRMRSERWEVVVSDPPSFAPSQRALLEALPAYRRLHRLCASVLAPGGLLCAASCSSHVDRAAFLASIAAGCADVGRRFELLELRGAAADHPVISAFPQGDYLKFAAGVVT